MESRICNKCQQTLEIHKFRKDGDRYRQTCKTCSKGVFHKKPIVKLEPVYKPPIEEQKVQVPYNVPLYERPVYVPPKWGR